MYREIARCRLCGNEDLVSTLHLGNQSLTGVFPKSKDQAVTSGPLELVRCRGEGDGKTCGLVQLRQSYSPQEMYGDNYGYRSGLNPSMVSHLGDIIRKIRTWVDLRPGDLVVDIGSNDGTLLQAYPLNDLRLVGVDPTGKKFREFYPDHIELIADFFSSAAVRSAFGSRRAKAITSIAMLYDLERPIDFLREVHEVLDDDGVWVFEQSYLPAMLERGAYDTVCQEHLEYYGLRQIQWMMKTVGFRILEVELNAVNGGSFCVTVAKEESSWPEDNAAVHALVERERKMGLDTARPYERFREHVLRHREDMLRLVRSIQAEGKRLIGSGASTKGNVILQFCGLTAREIPYIMEVNADKFGSYTPGTLIPIISEDQGRKLHPNYILVLPWHFRETFLSREETFLKSGGKLIFPLPSITVVGE